MALRIENESLVTGQVIALRCQGDLDAHTFEVLDEAIATLVDEGINQFVVDLAKVPYISSAGIGVLIGSRNETEGRGGGLVLLNPTEDVLDVFSTMGFDTLFDIVTSDDEALKKLGVGSSSDSGDAAPTKDRKDTARRKGFDF